MNQNDEDDDDAPQETTSGGVSDGRVPYDRNQSQGSGQRRTTPNRQEGVVNNNGSQGAQSNDNELKTDEEKKAEQKQKKAEQKNQTKEQKKEAKQQKKEEKKESGSGGGIVSRFISRKIMAFVISGILGFVGLMMLIIIILLPTLIIAGAIMEVTDWIKDGVNAIGEFVGDLIGGIGSDDLVIEIDPSDIPEDFDLSKNNPAWDKATPNGRAIAVAAVNIVRLNKPYLYGGHPTGPYPDGIPDTGLDCAGFVQASIWTGIGRNPGYLTTQAISDGIGSTFMQIDCSDLQVGDIGLKRRGGSVDGNTNHTGVYIGNNLWAHAAGKKTGMVISTYSNFKICLRYNG